MAQNGPDSIVPYNLTQNPLDIVAMEGQHQAWSACQPVEAPPPVVVGGVGLAERVWSPLTTELKHVPYGPIGNVNSLHNSELSSVALEGIAYRNKFLSRPKCGNINEIAKAFIGVVQADARGVEDRIRGWDLVVRGGNYDQDIRTAFHNAHIDGGPLTLRYVASVIGVTTMFAETAVGKPDVSDAGILHNAAVALKPATPNIVYRFGAMTVHAAPPPNNQPRLFLSATAWLEQ